MTRRSGRCSRRSTAWTRCSRARRYLAGLQHTLADWRAFPTLMRFDLVYHGLFRCNRRRLIDYDNLWPYLRDLYQTPRVAATVNFDHFIRGYNLNLPQLNPHTYRVTLRLWVTYTPAGRTYRSIGFDGLHLPSECVDLDRDADCDAAG